MAKIRMTAIHTIYAGKPGDDPTPPGEDFTVESQDEADRLKARGAARDSEATARAKTKAAADGKAEADAKAKAEADEQARIEAEQRAAAGSQSVDTGTGSTGNLLDAGESQ